MPALTEYMQKNKLYSFIFLSFSESFDKQLVVSPSPSLIFLYSYVKCFFDYKQLFLLVYFLFLHFV